MYHPYLRGKQNELLVVREYAELIQESGFVPVIEPVKKSFRGLRSAISSVQEVEGRAIVVLNPSVGELQNDHDAVLNFIAHEEVFNQPVIPGIMLTLDTTLDQVRTLLVSCRDADSIAFVHAGFADAGSLRRAIDNIGKPIKHLFFDHKCGILYRAQFATQNNASSILILDGYQRKRNSDYSLSEWYADIHLTYAMQKADGFGDFLIVGDEYFESGGPAYAVAIHISYIDPDDQDQMHIYHFVSDTNDSPVDPAGKFMEALTKLIAMVARPDTFIYDTKAVREFRELFRKRHYPGLGYVKKLSMAHHIETLSKYLLSH